MMSAEASGNVGVKRCSDAVKLLKLLTWKSRFWNGKTVFSAYITDSVLGIHNGHGLNCLRGMRRGVQGLGLMG